MSYWDIRKRAKLNHLPAPDPELVRAGVGDKDTRLRQSRHWLELYHAEKAQAEGSYDEEIQTDGGYEESLAAEAARVANAVADSG